MIDNSQATLDIISAHRIANKSRGGSIDISEHPMDTGEKETEELLKKYFLNSFQTPEFYNFSFSNGDFKMNPMFGFCRELFEAGSNFHTISVHMAKYLYESGEHPMIKDGDVFFAYISGIRIEGNSMDALGIFKSESVQELLKLEKNKKEFRLQRIEGMQSDKPDKACLIFNTDGEKGYKICISDRSNKGEEAAYWKDRFLNVSPAADEFHQTKEFLNITKEYVTAKITEEFEMNKSDQIDLLNRSMDYFKTHDNFVKEEFEEEVFRDPAVISSFRSFDNSYRQEHSLEINDGFDISLSAVKKQSRVFKSILKLDRNFHIYIHGNKDMIEHGVEKDGRKFYKIYYEKES